MANNQASELANRIDKNTGDNTVRRFSNPGCNHKCSQGGKWSWPLQISSISRRCVLRDAVFQTKYCCSLKLKIFGPFKNLGLATLLVVTNHLRKLSLTCFPSEFGNRLNLQTNS